MCIRRESMEKELGRVALDFLEALNYEVIQNRAESKALKALGDIRAILDDPGLDDFQCIEEIVQVFEGLGVSTARHDFG